MLNAIRNGWAKTRVFVSSTLFPSTSEAQAALPPAPLSFPPTGGLRVARASFQASLDDLQGDSAAQLRSSIQHCRSLMDLWHLRTWLYTEVAKAHSQGEAERRLQALSAFFGERSTALKRH